MVERFASEKVEFAERSFATFTTSETCAKLRLFRGALQLLTMCGR